MCPGSASHASALRRGRPSPLRNSNVDSLLFHWHYVVPPSLYPPLSTVIPLLARNDLPVDSPYTSNKQVNNAIPPSPRSCSVSTCVHRYLSGRVSIHVCAPLPQRPCQYPRVCTATSAAVVSRPPRILPGIGSAVSWLEFIIVSDTSATDDERYKRQSTGGQRILIVLRGS